MSKAYVSADLRGLVCNRANFACEYCLMPEIYVFVPHEIDHIIAEKHGGQTNENNLALACTICNKYKGSDLASINLLNGEIVRLYHPHNLATQLAETTSEPVHNRLKYQPLQNTEYKTLNNQVTVTIIDTGISPERLENPVMLPGINLSGEGMAEDTTDSGNHGTAIAKTILSIAPQTRLVPIRLMNRWGSLRKREKVEEAFDWILEHREALGINIVCAAFADFSNATSDAEHRGSRLQRQIAALRKMNIMTVAPAGNWYQQFRRKSTQGMAWPAIIREVISVGEVERREDGLWLTRRTQRLISDLDTGCGTILFAEPYELGETSGAAAVVAGLLAKLKQIYPYTTVNTLIMCLLSHGEIVHDENTSSWISVNRECINQDLPCPLIVEP